jgi:PPIC-type PPIASE domain
MSRQSRERLPLTHPLRQTPATPHSPGDRSWKHAAKTLAAIASVAAVSRRALVIAAILTLVCSGLAACGAGTSTHAVNTAKATAPTAIVADVGATPITQAAVERWVALLAADAEVPLPPSYTACIAHLKAASTPATGTSAPSQRQLKTDCEAIHQLFEHAALSTAIHADWLIDQAGESRLRTDSQQIARDFESHARHAFPSTAELLTQAQQSPLGQTYDAELERLTSQAYATFIDRSAHHSTRAQALSYYHTHLRLYTIPEGRALRILRIGTEKAALEAKREIEAGMPFGRVIAQQIPPELLQPDLAKKGYVPDLIPKYYDEPPLNNAIFSAPPRRLEGPVSFEPHDVRDTAPSNGYFLFEVTHITPPHPRPFAEVEATIHQELEELLSARAAAEFKAFTTRWTARTTCHAGYTTPDCGRS